MFKLRLDVSQLLALSSAILWVSGVTPLTRGAEPPAVAVPLRGHTETVYAIGFTPDGKQVITGSFDHTLKLWDAATGAEIRSFAGPAGHQNLVLSLSISPDGQTLASGGADNTVKLWDIPSVSSLRRFPQSSDATAI